MAVIECYASTELFEDHPPVFPAQQRRMRLPRDPSLRTIETNHEALSPPHSIENEEVCDLEDFEPIIHFGYRRSLRIQNMLGAPPIYDHSKFQEWQDY